MCPIFCPNRSPSCAVEDTRNDTKQVIVVGYSFKIFVLTKIRGIMNAIVIRKTQPTTYIYAL